MRKRSKEMGEERRGRPTKTKDYERAPHPGLVQPHGLEALLFPSVLTLGVLISTLEV